MMIDMKLDKARLQIYSIGHSTMTELELVEKLKKFSIDVVADVRSSPFSRRLPHFNKLAIKASLREHNIDYVFLGKELGGRPSNTSDFSGGVANYERMSQRQDFIEGLKRLKKGAQKFRVVMMCSEQNPLECHRCLLVGKSLSDDECDVLHILKNESILNQNQIEDRLLEMHSSLHDDLFLPRDDRLRAAYREQNERVAYSIYDIRASEEAK